jgi:two-component system chemotaxis response regulator CheB
MSQIKVLIVDKNILVRQAIAGILRKDSRFKVFGIYGQKDLIGKSIEDTKPDVVLLDIESSDSLEVLSSLETKHPELPVVVLSPRTTEGAKLALAALKLGAIDFITKPRFNRSLLFAGRHLNKRLIPILRTAVKAKSAKRARTIKDKSSTSLQFPFSETPALGNNLSRKRMPKVIIIGACTGGPKALSTLISGLPEDFHIPVVVAQHLPRYYTSELANNLDKESAISVEEAYEDAPLRPGKVWITPGGYHSEITMWNCKPFLRMHKGPREEGDRPSINNLFRSASGIFGRDILGIILSGRGKDGVEGAGIVSRSGGIMIVQDPDSALVPELPAKVIQNGYADFYCDINKMAGQLINLWSKDTSTEKEEHNRQTLRGGVYRSESAKYLTYY